MADSDKQHPSERGSTGGSRRPADAAQTGAFMRPKRLLAGLGWNTLGQFLVVGISLGLTPFLLHRLGATQYGVFVFVSTLRGLLSNLDGGLGPTGYRYFPVYVGRGDKAATTRLLFTMISLVAIVVGSEAIAVSLLAPDAAKVFALGSGLAAYSHESAQVLRELMPALFIAAVRTPIQRLIMAHHRWAFINSSDVLAVVASTVVTVVVAYKTSGLQCLVWGAYVQEVFVLITLVWACRSYISLRGFHWLPISEVREILRFGSRVQIAAVASSLSNELDTLVMGFFFPAKYVAYYGIGSNFNAQVLSMTYNGLNPIAQDIGREYGRSGKQGVLRSFSGVQSRWVTIIAIFPLAATLVGWFGVRVWLGDGSQFASATAAILVIGTALPILNSIVDLTAKTIEMPEIESWYLGIGVVVNLACTIALARSVGAIGIPIGTTIGQVVSFIVCIYLARRKIGKQIIPFFQQLSYFPILIALAVAAIGEWFLGKSLPTGGAGFVLSGILTLPAFIIYYGWVFREPILQKLGSRTLHEESRGEVEADDSVYARRQWRGLQALLAISEPETTGRPLTDTTALQLRGLQVLLAMSEPDMSVLPHSTVSSRLRYTSPLVRYTVQQADWQPLEPRFEPRS